MSTLYRKYRPKNFSEIVGQEHITKTLMNAILSGNIVHAYLFSGIRGTGKTSLARIFAKALNCEKRDGAEACNKCSSCLEINNNSAIDLIEVDAASYTGIDDMRELIKGAYLLPTKLKYKIFIIDECHQLSKHAINALLKTLEEPPAHVIFILVTTEIQKIIPTILSRCQTFTFWKVKEGEIVKRLESISKQEGVLIEKEALEIITLNSQGSIRDAESLLGQVFTLSSLTLTKKRDKIKLEDVKKILGLVETTLIIQLMDLIIEDKETEIIIFLKELSEKSIDFQEFIKTLINYVRHLLIFKISRENSLISGLTNEELTKLQRQSEKLSREKIETLLISLIEAERNIRYSPNPYLLTELTILKN